MQKISSKNATGEIPVANICFKREVYNIVYILTLNIGTWHQFSYSYILLSSRDKKVLHQIKTKIESTVQNGFSATKKMFDELDLNMPYSDENLFDEMYKGNLFRVSIDKIKEI